MKFDGLTLQEKIDTRESTIKALRELNDGCKNGAGEVRAMTAEESSKFEAMKADVESLTAMIDSERRSQTLDGFVTSVPVAGKILRQRPTRWKISARSSGWKSATCLLMEAQALPQPLPRNSL